MLVALAVSCSGNACLQSWAKMKVRVNRKGFTSDKKSESKIPSCKSQKWTWKWPIRPQLQFNHKWKVNVKVNVNKNPVITVSKSTKKINFKNRCECFSSNWCLQSLTWDGLLWGAGQTQAVSCSRLSDTLARQVSLWKKCFIPENYSNRPFVHEMDIVFHPDKSFPQFEQFCRVYFWRNWSIAVPAWNCT